MSHSTPEYLTLISLNDELRRAVQSDLTPICGELVAKHLISPDNARRLRNQMHSEIDRAAELVDIIQNKVQQNPGHYHTFLQVLESRGIDYYHDILNRLNEVYQQHGGNTQQPKPRIEADDGNPSVRVDAHQENSTIHTGELSSYLLKIGGFVLLIGAVLGCIIYYYEARQPGTTSTGLETVQVDQNQGCTKIESPQVLFQELAEIGSWEHLCDNLGVSTATMNSLKYESAQNTEKKRQCLKAFYSEDTERGVHVCWETVVKAVNSFPISNRKLAKKIANKYNINTAMIDP